MQEKSNWPLVKRRYIVEDIAQQMVVLRLTDEHKDAYALRVLEYVPLIDTTINIFKPGCARECPKLHFMHIIHLLEEATAA